MNYKVCVYAICKDEEQFVSRWMDSMGEADLVVVTDTGSSDRTVEKLRERGAIVHTEEISPWRFDTARNISLSHVPDDVDICVCTDLDEIFTPGWRSALESAWEKDTTNARYLYNWSHRPDGSPDVQFNSFKIHKKEGFRWVCPIHEHLRYTLGEENAVFVPGIALDHYPDRSKSRSSYLELLKLAVEEDPKSARMAYYLGREYMYASMWPECIETLLACLEICSWGEERSAAMRWIAYSFLMLEDISACYAWYLRAISEAPHMRDPYVECARAAYATGDWATVVYMCNEALAITEKSTSYVNMGYSWDHTPYDLIALGYHGLGMYEKALSHARTALSYAPKSERLTENVRILEALVTIGKP